MTRSLHNVPFAIGLFSTTLLLLAGCAPRSIVILVTATPDGEQPQASLPQDGSSQSQQARPIGTPPPIDPAAFVIPTPDPTRIGVPDPLEEDLYIVQFGDSLSLIAERYGVAPESLLEANDLTNEDLLTVGQPLVIPLGVSRIGPDTKLIPDSELVYGPTAKDFDVAAFIAPLPGFITTYSEFVDGIELTSAQIVERVALETSVNPRLMLALLEYESSWLTDPSVSDLERAYPMDYLDDPGVALGLYKQLSWAANQLNAGYYGWRQNGLQVVLLADGTRVAHAATLNAGTVGVQRLLGRTRNWPQWQVATGYSGFLRIYVALFGTPFQNAFEPLIPLDLAQPELSFPWSAGEAWYYTGGPHGGWTAGTAWAAVDFATGDQGLGCYVSDAWATAVADGVIARTGLGVVVLDLDGDGYEGTGWTIFYMHMSSEERSVKAGDIVQRGDPIGHPSCEGGFSNATHLHFARRYNGEWVAADCSRCMLTVPAPPLVLSGWQATSFEYEYDGSFERDAEYREARQVREPINELIYFE